MSEWLKKFLLFFLLSIFLLNSFGCSKKSYFETYIERLEILLGARIQSPTNLISVALPRRVVTDKKSRSTSIDLLDFLALSPCELQLIIARRNSALGKVALESQKLINDLLFLNAAEQCLNRLSSNDKVLREKIREAILDKKNNLPANIARATLGGPEYREMWSRSVEDLFFDGRGILALTYIRDKSENWLEGKYHIEGSELENNLSILRASPLAEYMRHILRNNYYLSRLTILIEEEYRRGGFCREGVITEKGVILRNLVKTYFTKASSNEINIVSRGSSAFLVEIEKLNQILANVLSSEYKNFFSDQFGAVVQSKRILREHSAALEPIIFGCSSGLAY